MGYYKLVYVGIDLLLTATGLCMCVLSCYRQLQAYVREYWAAIGCYRLMYVSAQLL